LPVRADRHRLDAAKGLGEYGAGQVQAFGLLIA
jgi:hypothetical protein